MQELTQESVAAPSSVPTAEQSDNVHQNPIMRVLAIAISLVLLAVGISAYFNGGEAGSSTKTARVWPATATERRIERNAIVERDAALQQWVADEKVRQEKLLAFYTEATRQIQASEAQAAARARANAARSTAVKRNSGCNSLETCRVCITNHESANAGLYKAENPTSTASGRYQVLDSTWDGYGGYAHAADAPPAVQDQWYNEAYAASGTRNWNGSNC